MLTLALRRAGLVVASLGILTWRLLSQPFLNFCGDWMVVAVLYSLYLAYDWREGPRRDLVTSTFMTYLLGTYLLGQLPHTLATLLAN